MTTSSEWAADRRALLERAERAEAELARIRDADDTSAGRQRELLRAERDAAYALLLPLVERYEAYCEYCFGVRGTCAGSAKSYGIACPADSARALLAREGTGR